MASTLIKAINEIRHITIDELISDNIVNMDNKPDTEQEKEQAETKKFQKTIDKYILL